MSRPHNTFNPSLAEAVEARMSAIGISLRKLAQATGADVATLSRSLRAQSFSREISGRLAVWLDDAGHDNEVQTMLRKTLQELKVERRRIARMEAMLMVALDRLDDRQ